MATVLADWVGGQPLEFGHHLAQVVPGPTPIRVVVPSEHITALFCPANVVDQRPEE